MDTLRYFLALIAASVAMSFSDWYFMGVLFHDKYLAHPEVWRRPEGGKGESLAVAWSTLLGVATAAVFLWLCAWLGLAGSASALGLAFGIWLLAPLPLIVTNALFIKIHFLNTLALALGWLMRLLICALAAWLILR
ncbi:MAG TPA: hypothetical protein VKT74_07125 [Gammaproteobacteria bacterium]|nr:hypothetical protein [Gammaproteobacteria bacterium]